MGTKHGCCADKCCTPETCMELPAGKTCGVCANYARCLGLFSCKMDNTACDFFPRRFTRTPIDDRDAELAALRAQLAAAETRARKAEEENKRIREDCAEFRIQAGEAKLREMSSPCLACKQLAAARSDAVREFAEWCNGEDQFLQFDWERQLARYLAERGGK